MMEKLMVVVLGYILGSLSIPRLIFTLKQTNVPPKPIVSYSTDGRAKLVAHQIGSTNVLLTFGKRWGLLTMALDILKAFLPVVLLKLYSPDPSLHLLAAGAIFLGVLWPVWFRFQGGGGNSCILGIQLAISPLGLLVTHAGGALLGRKYPRYTFVAVVVLIIPWFAIRFGFLSGEVLLGIFLSVAYILGQIPEAMELHRMEKEGHVFELDQVMKMMKNPQENPTLLKEDDGDES